MRHAGLGLLIPVLLLGCGSDESSGLFGDSPLPDASSGDTSPQDGVADELLDARLEAPDDGPANIDEQKAICARYIQCLTDADPSQVGNAVANYGPSSACWSQDQESAAACGRACANLWATVVAQHQGSLPASCRECNTNSECRKPAAPICSLDLGTCQPCTSDEQCSSDNPLSCDLFTGVCETLQVCGQVRLTCHPDSNGNEFRIGYCHADGSLARVQRFSGYDATASATDGYLYSPFQDGIEWMRILNGQSTACFKFHAAVSIGDLAHAPYEQEDCTTHVKNYCVVVDASDPAVYNNGPCNGTIASRWRSTWDGTGRVLKREYDQTNSGTFDSWCDYEYP